jgi:hypothetical protein
LKIYTMVLRRILRHGAVSAASVGAGAGLGRR